MKLILAQKIIEYLIDLIIVIIIIIFFRNWDIWRHEFSVSIAFIYQKPNWAWGALKKECSIFCVSLCWRCSFDSFMEEWSWICVYVGGNLLLWFCTSDRCPPHRIILFPTFVNWWWIYTCSLQSCYLRIFLIGTSILTIQNNFLVISIRTVSVLIVLNLLKSCQT